MHVEEHISAQTVRPSPVLPADTVQMPSTPLVMCGICRYQVHSRPASSAHCTGSQAQGSRRVARSTGSSRASGKRGLDAEVAPQKLNGSAPRGLFIEQMHGTR